MCVRKSRYNHLFKKEDKSFLYNSLTNSFALIDDDLFEILSEKSKMSFLLINWIPTHWLCCVK